MGRQERGGRRTREKKCTQAGTEEVVGRIGGTPQAVEENFLYNNRNVVWTIKLVC